MTTKYYAGIGSRSTPANICELMQQLGQKLGLRGMGLRSGGADGADEAFENGCELVKGVKQIFYAHNYIERWIKEGTDLVYESPRIYRSELWEEATKIAAQHHPAWSYCKPYARKLHTRNCFQMLGWNLQEPAKFAICWTPDGARMATETSQATGGTGQAIRVASTYGVRVYNLAVTEDLQLAQSWIAR